MLSGFLPDEYFVSHGSHGIFYQNAFSPGELSVISVMRFRMCIKQA